MKIFKILCSISCMFFSQCLVAAIPDTIIVVESRQAQWAAGTLDSLDASTDTLKLDTVRTYHFNFTNCGQTGRLGPSQASCTAAYIGTDLAGAVTVVDSGAQQWQTPEAGIYRILAAGARHNSDSFIRGAIVRADFELLKSDTLKILVGQMGTSARGGNGGTFVTYVDTTPIIVAGGAAGMRSYVDAANRGSTSTSGQSVSGPGCSAVGGTAGAGGEALGGGNCSGAGGGIYGDGQGCGGGLAFIHGGSGGSGQYLGGFGGGGGVNSSSSPGGGGGYSGGSVHYTGGPSSCAGGGGSFIDSSATHVATSDGYYDNSNTFNGDTIESFNDWHIGHGMVNMDASKYVTAGNRISPVHDISVPFSTLNSSQVDWSADIFAGTSLTVETRHSLDGGNTWSLWNIVATNGSAIPGLLPGALMDSARVQTRMSFATAALFASPQVYSITITVITDSLMTGVKKYPEALQSLKVFPNPVHSSFKINYSLTRSSEVVIRLCSMIGQSTTFQEATVQPAGRHAIEVNTSALNMSSGIFWIELIVNGQTIREKLVRY